MLLHVPFVLFVFLALANGASADVVSSISPKYISLHGAPIIDSAIGFERWLLFLAIMLIFVAVSMLALGVAVIYSRQAESVRNKKKSQGGAGVPSNQREVNSPFFYFFFNDAGKLRPSNTDALFWVEGIYAERHTKRNTNGSVGVKTSEDDYEAKISSLFAPDVQKILRSHIDLFLKDSVVFDIPFLPQKFGKGLRIFSSFCGSRAQIVFQNAPDAHAEIGNLQSKISILEKRFSQVSSILNLLPFPVWARNVASDVTVANPAYARAVGVGSISNAIRQHAELTERRDNAHEARMFAESVIQTQEIRSERRNIIVEGARRVLCLTEIPDISAGTVGYAQDDTDKVELEGMFDVQAQIYTEILNHISVGIAIFGKDQTIEFYNSALLDIWGIDAQILDNRASHRGILDLLRERNRAPVVEDYVAWRTSVLGMYMRTDSLEDQLWNLPDGSSYNVVPLANSMGGIVFLYENITEKISLERRYNKVVATRRATLDGLCEGVVVFGADGYVQLYNPAFIQMWFPNGGSGVDVGIHVSELAELCYALFQDKIFWQEMFSSLTEGTQRIERQAKIYRADDSVLQVTASPLPEGAVLFTFSNVTEQQKAESSLRERAEILAADDEYKRAFLTQLSHRLRTPLSTILGFAEILREGMFGDLNGQQADYIDGIVRSSLDLRVLVDDVLELTAVETGCVDAVEEAVDLRVIIGDIAGIVHSRLQNSYQKIVVQVSGSVELYKIHGDKERLQRALFIIVSSVAEGASEEFDIRVTIANSSAESVSCAIKCIASEELCSEYKKIFESQYSQMGCSDAIYDQSKRERSLTLAKRIIEVYGGWVLVEVHNFRELTLKCQIPIAFKRVELVTTDFVQDKDCVSYPLI